MTLLFVFKVLGAWNSVIYNLWKILNDIDTNSKLSSRTTLVNNVCCKFYVDIWWYYYFNDLLFYVFVLFFYLDRAQTTIIVCYLLRN